MNNTDSKLGNSISIFKLPREGILSTVAGVPGPPSTTEDVVADFSAVGI